jgi:hypothetical protein
MNRPFPLIILLISTAFTGMAAAADDAALTSEGWTVSADSGRSTLSISHERVGLVMKDITFLVQDGPRRVPITGWEVEKRDAGELSFRTARPGVAWRIRLLPQALKISCTSSVGRLSASVPAPSGRIPARVMDAGGTPVDWVGTDEVVKAFGGSETRNRSYLPVLNPEVMTFALGQISSANLHCLFDRMTDTVIAFSDEARLARDPQDSNLFLADIPVPGNTMVRIIPDYYTKVLGLPFYIPFDDTVFPRPPLVWCSWTGYYHDAREEDIVRNTDWLASRLQPYGFGYVQIDSGYDRDDQGRHFWIEKWKPNLFPHGPEWLARYIKSRGLKPGLWLVPNSYAGAVESHPGWYLRDKKGDFILNYGTPALDSSNPEVLGFLKDLFSTLRGWGFEYFKFDGEHPLPRTVPAVDQERLFDQNIDPIAAYRNRLAVIREAIGSETFVEGCPAGAPLFGTGYFNSCFTGHDIYNSWQGQYPFFSSINANAFLNHLVFYVMPGEGIDVGPPMTVEDARLKRVPAVVGTAESRESPLKGFGVTLPEARTLTTWVSLTGVAYSLASVLPELPEERIRLLEMTMPPMPILPVDLFSRGTDMRWDIFKRTTPDDYLHDYPEILDLKVKAVSGTYDVVALTNWRSGGVTREVSFHEKLGLDTGVPIIAFDFWGQKLLGVFRERLSVAIEPHDTRVIALHPLLDRPQLIGTSRHISGSYSIIDLAWEPSARRLRGISESVPGKETTLFFHVPEGMAVSRVKAAGQEGNGIAVRSEIAGNLLTLGFQGQTDPVNWEIEFTSR